MALAASQETDTEKYKCAICLDIYEDPVIIPCGNKHVACLACVNPVLKQSPPKCGLCRTSFVAKKVVKHKYLKLEMQSTPVSCQGCKKQILVADVRQHEASCDKIDRSIKQFQPVHNTTQIVPKDLPNRSTFSCPFCGLKNLDVSGLVKHCNVQHKGDNTPVVCPVCASMPWGDNSMKSSNFHSHINHRHQFEYDTYVDYEQDDDDMLQAALAASMQFL